MHPIRQFFFINILLFLSTVTLAQRITGIVRPMTDSRSEAAKPGIPFATVALLRPDSSLVKGTIADAEGRYELTDLTPGAYRLTASMVGYRPAPPVPIALGPADQTHDLTLTEAVATLGEVRVRATKPFVEVSADRTVLNVEGSIVAAGTMAADVLRRAPGVTIDNRGNISLKGKEGVLILLDGKPALLDERQLAALLRSLPSNQIARIEVMTNPPARYDAQGNAGVINIRLRKNQRYGTNGNLSLSQGQGRYFKTNASLSLSHRQGRWNLSGNYDYNPRQDYNEYRQDRRQPGTGTVRRLLTRQDYVVPGHSHTAKAGAELSLTDRTTLDLTGTGQWNLETYEGSNQTQGFDGAGQLTEQTRSTDINPDRYTNRSCRLGFRHTFGNPTDTASGQKNHELTAYADVARYGQQSSQDVLFWFLNGLDQPIKQQRLWSQISGQTDIFIAATDYVRPLGRYVTFETGLKITDVRVETSVQVQQQTNTEPIADQPNRNSEFRYNEQIQAAYVSGQYAQGNWQVRAGLRLENWRARGQQRLTGNGFRRDSLFLFPTASVQYQLSPAHALGLSYGRRIDRPQYQDLNPITYYTDPFTIFVGNPTLRPQLTNNLELTHTWQDGLLVTTLNYSRTDDYMAEYLPVPVIANGPVQALTTQNIARFTNAGLSMSLNLPLAKWWTVQAYGNGYWNQFAGSYLGTSLNNAAWAWQANLTNQLKLPKSWSVEVVGSYQSGKADGVGRLLPMGMLTLGVARPLWNETGTLRLSVQDMFRSFRYADETQIGPINQTGSYRWDNRIVTLALTWRFGKTTLTPNRPTAPADDRAGGGRR